jgi:hypothetical protein
MATRARSCRPCTTNRLEAAKAHRDPIALRERFEPQRAFRARAGDAGDDLPNRFSVGRNLKIDREPPLAVVAFERGHDHVARIEALDQNISQSRSHRLAGRQSSDCCHRRLSRDRWLSLPYLLSAS